jgi:hypothetical protein
MPPCPRVYWIPSSINPSPLEDDALAPRFTRTPCELLKEFLWNLRIYEEVFENFTKTGVL